MNAMHMGKSALPFDWFKYMLTIGSLTQYIDFEKFYRQLNDLLTSLTLRFQKTAMRDAYNRLLVSLEFHIYF